MHPSLVVLPVIFVRCHHVICYVQKFLMSSAEFSHSLSYLNLRPGYKHDGISCYFSMLYMSNKYCSKMQMPKTAFSSSPRATSILYYLSYGISVWKLIWACCFLIAWSNPNILQNLVKWCHFKHSKYRDNVPPANPRLCLAKWVSHQVTKCQLS